jgi:hypothetical protein
MQYQVEGIGLVLSEGKCNRRSLRDDKQEDKQPQQKLNYGSGDRGTGNDGMDGRIGCCVDRLRVD